MNLSSITQRTQLLVQDGVHAKIVAVNLPETRDDKNTCTQEVRSDVQRPHDKPSDGWSKSCQRLRVTGLNEVWAVTDRIPQDDAAPGFL